MKIRRDVVNLAMPILTEQVCIKLMGVVNAIMAGRLGTEVMSAIGMVDALNSIFINLFTSMAVGGTVVVAHYTGRRDWKSCNETARHAFLSGGIISFSATLLIYVFIGGVVGVLYGSAEQAVLDNLYIYLKITLLTFPLMALTAVASGVLRGVGNTRTPMQINIIMNVLNVVFSYVFIYGIKLEGAHFNISVPGMGIAGAATGIALARLAGTLLSIYALTNGSNKICMRFDRKFRLNWELLKSIYGIGLPSGAESLLFNGGKLIIQTFIVGMGTSVLAVNYVFNSIAGITSIPADALNITATVLVGQYMGRNESEEAKRALLYVMKLSSICLAVIGVVAFPLTGLMVSVFTDNREVVELSSLLLKIHLVLMPLMHAFSFVLPAGLKATGDAKLTMMVSFFSMWAFRVVMGYIFGVVLNFGIIGIWIGAYIDWLARSILFYIRLQRGKWKENVVIRENAQTV